ncbi:MAG: MarR family transcriptional regulator [Erysipelothrix sp.]|nr:MarR family transcriptional regulator [Erysipelothrix sp.]
MELKLKPLIVLFKAQQSLVYNVKVSLKDSVLTVNEFTVMEALSTKKELVTQELAGKILIPNSSLTYVLDILEEKGYLSRRKDENDRRRQIVSLTKEGQRVFDEIYAQHFEYMENIFSVLSDEEQETLTTLLKRVGKHAESQLNCEDCE